MRINDSPALAIRSSLLPKFFVLFNILLLFLLFKTKFIMKPPVICLFNWLSSPRCKFLSLIWGQPLSHVCFRWLIVIFLVGNASFPQELPVLLVVILMLPALHCERGPKFIFTIVFLLLVLLFISIPSCSFSWVRLTAARSTFPIGFLLPIFIRISIPMVQLLSLVRSTSFIRTIIDIPVIRWPWSVLLTAILTRTIR